MGVSFSLTYSGAYHWAVRAEAFLSLILFPLDDRDFNKLRRQYFKETSPAVKKVILTLFLKARDRIKKPMFSATIQEPEEETNRFRKYIWALTNSPKVAQQSLAVLKRIEKDPARLLAALFAALQSRNVETLHLVGRIADGHLRDPQSELSRLAFAKVSSDVKYMIEELSAVKKRNESF